MFTNLTIHYGWWLLALVLVGAELMVPGFFMLWIGIAAAAVGLILLFAPPLSFEVQAIRAGDINAINYFVATRYVDALKAMVGAPNQKIMLLPMEATGILGSLAGIAELAKSSLLEQQSRASAEKAT